LAGVISEFPVGDADVDVEGGSLGGDFAQHVIERVMSEESNDLIFENGFVLVGVENGGAVEAFAIVGHLGELLLTVSETRISLQLLKKNVKAARS